MRYVELPFTMRSKQFDILIVDDDAEDRMIIGEALAELRCHEQVTIYESGFSFHKDLMLLRLLEPLPFLIVLDYNLPGADGAVLLGLLKNDPLLRNVPVVMYTTGLSPLQREDCLYKGAVECFEKGATYTDVLTFAGQLCAFAFHEHEPS